MKKQLLTLTTALLLFGGLTLMASSADSTLNAQLSGHGSSVLTQSSSDLQLINGSGHMAAFDEAPGLSAGMELLFGILLILLGFGIHMLLVLHQEQPKRLAQILNLPKTHHKKKSGFYRYTEWMWIDIK
jgi:hypothetical protein